MPKISDQKRAARRIQILDAAAKCFVQRGYATTTIEDVVAASGLSRGAIYSYFPNKMAVLQAHVERDFDDQLSHIRGLLVAPGADSRDVIRGVLQFYLAACRREPGSRWFVGEVISEVGSDPELRRIIQSAYGRLYEVLAEAVRAGQRTGQVTTAVDAPSAARLLTALVEGLRRQWFAEWDQIDWDSLESSITRFVESALGMATMEQPRAVYRDGSDGRHGGAA